MQRFAPLIARVCAVAMFLVASAPAFGQSGDNAKPRLVSELTDAGGDSLTLNVTFYGARPTPDKAEETLRKSLEAATVTHPGKDISANAWFRVSADSSDRQAIALTGATESLLYVAKDQTIRDAGDNAAAPQEKAAGASDDLATLMENKKIVKACQEFPQDQLPALAGVGLELRGQERKSIVKAMRAWCKANDIATSRKVGVCISSISKAVVAMKSEVSLSPEDLAAAISRGKTAFTGANGCTNCHQTNGRGGQRGPDLTDNTWLHCDGSIEGIKKVILAGVSTSKLKNPSFPSMRASTSLVGQDEALADLAIYVQSLSGK